MAIRCVPGFVKAERLRQEAEKEIKKQKQAASPKGGMAGDLGSAPALSRR